MVERERFRGFRSINWRDCWPPVLWMAVIFATSCTVIGPKAFIHAVSKSSGARVSEGQFTEFWNSWWWVFVKGYHALEYAILAILLLWRVRVPAWGLLSFAALYAASDEYHQTYVPARGGRLTDVLIDSGGIALGAMIFWLTGRLRQRRQKGPQCGKRKEDRVGIPK